MRICIAIAVAASLAAFDCLSIVRAQSYGGSSSGRSSFGGSSYGRSSSGGMSSYGPSSGQGIFGSRTGANSKMGQGSFGDESLSLGPQGNLSSARFVRGNRQPGDFVGGNAQDMQQRFVGGNVDVGAGNWAQGGGGMSSWNSGGNNYGGNSNWRQNFNRNQGGRGQSGAQAAVPIRTTFRAAFDYAKPASSQLSTSLTQRLKGIRAQTPIQVELQERTATLQGVVATEHDRMLAEKLILLEPGVETVKNEIAVGSPTTEELTPPP